MAFVSKKEALSPIEKKNLQLLEYLHQQDDKYGKPLISLNGGYSFDNYIDYFYIDGVFVVLNYTASPTMESYHKSIWLVEISNIATISHNYDIDTYEAFKLPFPKKKENYENIVDFFLKECIAGVYNSGKPFTNYQYRITSDFVHGSIVHYLKIDSDKKYFDFLLDDIYAGVPSNLATSKNHAPMKHVDLIEIPLSCYETSGVNLIIPSLKTKIEVGLKTWH